MGVHWVPLERQVGKYMTTQGGIDVESEQLKTG